MGIILHWFHLIVNFSVLANFFGIILSFILRASFKDLNILIFALYLVFHHKTWVEEVRKKGGFSIIMEWQLYPIGYESLAKEIKEELGLKVDTPRAIQDGTMQRFINYGHNRFLE